MPEESYSREQVLEIVEISHTFKSYLTQRGRLQTAERNLAKDRLLASMKKYSLVFGEEIKEVESEYSGERGPEETEIIKKKRILLVDDEENVTAFFRSLLEKEGYDVDVANESREAFRKANANHYDLVHMDIRMPEWDGLDAIAAMSLTNPKIKILVVSGVLTDDIIRELEEEKNVKGWVEKPVSIDSYLRHVKNTISGD